MPQWNCQLDWWGRTSRFACQHQLHSCTFCTMSSKVLDLKPVNMFTKMDHYNQKINPCRKNASRTGMKDVDPETCHLFPLALRRTINSCTLCIITCSRGIYFTDLGQVLDLNVYVSWFIFVFTAQIQVLYTLQMSLWRYLGLKSTYISKRLFIWAFVKAWTEFLIRSDPVCCAGNTI